MKLPCVNKNGSKLFVLIKGDITYKDYNSIKELCSDLEVKRSNLEFWYS